MLASLGCYARINYNADIGIGGNYDLLFETNVDMNIPIYNNRLFVTTGLQYTLAHANPDDQLYLNRWRKTDECSVTTNSHYLSIPLLLEYKFGNATIGRLGIHCGPLFAVCLKASAKINMEFANKEISYTGDLFSSLPSDQQIFYTKGDMQRAYLPVFNRFSEGLRIGINYTFRFFNLGFDMDWYFNRVKDVANGASLYGNHPWFFAKVGYSF